MVFRTSCVMSGQHCYGASVCVFCFSHRSLFNKAEVRYDVILQKVNIQSALKLHRSRVAANVPSLCIKNICIGSTSSSHVGQGF